MEYSLANAVIVKEANRGRGAVMKIANEDRKRSGMRTEPWETPDVTGQSLEAVELLKDPCNAV